MRESGGASCYEPVRGMLRDRSTYQSAHDPPAFSKLERRLELQFLPELSQTRPDDGPSRRWQDQSSS